MDPHAWDRVFWHVLGVAFGSLMTFQRVSHWRRIAAAYRRDYCALREQIDRERGE